MLLMIFVRHLFFKEVILVGKLLLGEKCGKRNFVHFFISFLAARPAVIEIFHTSVARSKSILKQQIIISNSMVLMCGRH